MNYANCELENCDECWYDEDEEIYKCRVYSNCEVNSNFLCECEEDSL